MDDVHVGVFCKAPQPGRVKTRLAARLGESAAASLYTAFLGDTVTLAAASSGRRVILFHEGPPPRTWLPRLAAEVEEIPQGTGNLGDRLEASMREAGTRGWLPLLFLGSDSPDLPARQLEDALDALRRYDVVLGPAADGGVWCIGLRRPTPGFFAELPWSQSDTGQALRNRTRELGLKLGLVKPWTDVDEPADLDALGRRLEKGQTHAPQTRAWLSRHDTRTRGDG